MLYEVFIRLLDEALASSNLEMFIAERGWQDWMNNYSTDDVVKILNIIFNIAKKDLKSVRKLTGWSRSEFSKMYQIPLRTMENWENGERTPATYDIYFISYTVFNHLYLEDYENGNLHN